MWFNTFGLRAKHLTASFNIFWKLAEFIFCSLYVYQSTLIWLILYTKYIIIILSTTTQIRSKKLPCCIIWDSYYLELNLTVLQQQKELTYCRPQSKPNMSLLRRQRDIFPHVLRSTGGRCHWSNSLAEKLPPPFSHEVFVAGKVHNVRARQYQVRLKSNQNALYAGCWWWNVFELLLHTIY